jgi:hypothetical protein
VATTAWNLLPWWQRQLGICSRGGNDSLEFAPVVATTAYV